MAFPHNSLLHGLSLSPSSSTENSISTSPSRSGTSRISTLIQKFSSTFIYTNEILPSEAHIMITQQDLGGFKMWPVREYPLLTLVCYVGMRIHVACYMKWSRNGPIPYWPATAELTFMDSLVRISCHLDSPDGSKNVRQPRGSCARRKDS